MTLMWRRPAPPHAAAAVMITVAVPVEDARVMRLYLARGLTPRVRVLAADLCPAEELAGDRLGLCDLCGRPADGTTADAGATDTGHVESVALCRRCAGMLDAEVIT